MDITIGQATDVKAYLSGVAIAANGLPGAGASYNPDGSVAATAWVTGTPGVSASYGTNFTNWAEGVVQGLADGLYDQFGRPYDAPPPPGQ